MIKQPPSFKAFTLKSQSRLFALNTDIFVSKPIIGDEIIKAGDTRLVKTIALWDTGATVSCISRTLAHEMGLIVTGRTITSHAKGQSETNLYTIDIFLPNNIHVPLTEALEVESVDDKFGVIIGMNIINHGDFSITHADNLTTFSFRIPSISTIDYVLEGNTLREKRLSNIGRNDPCICGSGKKYKNCCEYKHRKH